MDWNRFKSNRWVPLGFAVAFAVIAAVLPLMFSSSESSFDLKPGDSVVFTEPRTASPAHGDVIATEGELITDPQLPVGWPSDEPYYVPSGHVYVGMQRTLGSAPKWDYQAVPLSRLLRRETTSKLTPKAPMAVVR
jgi:hypothetical protein